MSIVSKHPYVKYVPKNANKLIIGTMPPYRFCNNERNLCEEDVDFFYGSKDNYFWEILGNLTQKNLSFENTKSAVKERKDLLSSLNVAITDIVLECEHKNGNSDDNSLEEIVFNTDVLKDILDNNDIDTLIYTSLKVKSLMYQATKSYHSWSKDNKREGRIIIDGKEYKVIVLYSPSPSAKRRVNDDKRIQQYKGAFGIE